MKILITNDDGIHAPGLKILEEIARELSDDVTIVAPETDQSGVAHSLSLNDPLRLRQVQDKHYAVRGTPTDCVIMALRHVCTERPDLILSGVNRGQNMAEDVTYSGTIAAAIEGTLLGVRSIALSQAYSWATRSDVHWQTARTHAPALIQKLVALPMDEGVFLNVNFPDCVPSEVAGVEVTRQGRRDGEFLDVEKRHDGRGNPYFWLTFQGRLPRPDAGTDLAAIAAGRISVTPISLDMTAGAMLATLSGHLA